VTSTGPARQPYDVALTPEAQRQLASLPGKIVTAVLEGLYGSIARDPWRVSKPLHEELAGLRVARRGQYRLVFRIDEAKRLITARAVKLPSLGLERSPWDVGRPGGPARHGGRDGRPAPRG
jgi:mRNA interferase RelE/StbE